MQGGATAQFSAIPMNFLSLNPSQTVDYLVTGYWSEKAAKEAEKYGKVNWVIPKQDKYQSIATYKDFLSDLIIFILSRSCRRYVEINRKFFVLLLLLE